MERTHLQIIRIQMSAKPPAKKTAGLIEKETDERRTSNECILSALKKISRSDAIVRHSSFDIHDSIFAF